MQDFKRVLDLFKSKKIIKQFNFSIGFLNSKNLFFFKKLQKIAQWLEAWPPDPVYDTFELH